MRPQNRERKLHFYSNIANGFAAGHLHGLKLLLLLLIIYFTSLQSKI